MFEIREAAAVFSPIQQVRSFPMIVSVIVTGKNVERYLHSCLGAILEQERGGGVGLEVIYCDGGSDDRSVEVAREESMRHEDVPLTIVRDITADSPARGRNTGVRLSKGDIVAFVDADCVVPARWLDSIRTAFESDGELAAVGSGYLPERDSPFANRLVYFSLGTLVGSAGSAQFRYFKRPGYVKSIPAGNSAYRASVLPVGCFDERLSYCEDYDLNDRVARGGGGTRRRRILLEPAMYSTHLKRYTGSYALRLLFRYGRGRAESIFRVGRRLVSPQLILMLLLALVIPLVPLILIALVRAPLISVILLICLFAYVIFEVRPYPRVFGREKTYVVLLSPLVLGIIISSYLAYLAGFLFGVASSGWGRVR